MHHGGMRMHRSRALGKRPSRSCVLRPFISEGISLLGHPWHGTPGTARSGLRPGKHRLKGGYFTSTVAPASVNFFLMASASSLFTPSLIGLGAPSTRSFASFRPRLVTSRTALMTLILFAPTAVSTTLNSVCSSAGAAAPGAPAPAPATATGAAAAAETPRTSSSFFTSSAASSRVSALISSTILSMRSDIGFPPEKLPARLLGPQTLRVTSLLRTFLKPFFLHPLLDHVSQVARHARHGGGEALSGRVDQ